MFGAPSPAVTPTEAFDQAVSDLHAAVEIQRAAVQASMLQSAEALGGVAASREGPEAATPTESEAYTVLARKYRPRAFEDLIGQEAMVRTLTNAFATGRIAHAFMLTGVRGVGKTTTARLLARALNNETETIDKPSPVSYTHLRAHET